MTDGQLVAAFTLAAGLIGAGVLIWLYRDVTGPDLPPPPGVIDLTRRKR